VDAGKIGAVDVETGENPAQPDEHRMPQVIGDGSSRTMNRRDATRSSAASSHASSSASLTSLK